MIAEFYIVNHSFRCPENIDVETLEEKIKLLSEDYLYIRKYKETDKILVNPSIYEECIYEDLSIYEMLFTKKGKKYFDGDIRKALFTILDRSEETENTLEDIIDVLLPEQSEDLVHGLLCLHQVEEIAEQFLVYDKNNWLTFHRHFLGLYPKDVTHYFNECVKYFPNLYFHERNKKTIAKIHPDFVKKIILYLSWLNDSFTNLRNEELPRFERLKSFSSLFPFDFIRSSKKKQNFPVTLEGKIKKKPLLSFEFENNQGEIEVICCEPHMKMAYSDNYPGDSKYYQYRIYFHEGKENIAEGRILVGHIGEHL
jgi:hypothetical protein